MEILSNLVILILLSSTIKAGASDYEEINVGLRDHEEVRVGLVVDLGSIEGKILQNSFTLALSDFYSINKGYKTRVTISVRDSQGDPILAHAADEFYLITAFFFYIFAKNLVKKTKVKVIVVGGQSLQEAKLLAMISEKARVPVISTFMPNSLSLREYNHFIQLTYDTYSEAKGITSLIHDYNVNSVVIIYEDADDWGESLHILVENFQDEGIDIARIVSFPVSSSGENHMMNQLRKIKVSRATVFVMHMSETLVSSLFRCVEKLNLMEEGYAWILTARTMNHFHYSDVTLRSMQGVIGFKSYIPVSKEVMSFTLRLRKLVGDDTETERVSVVIGVRTHDIACILATAIEKVSLKGKDEASANVSGLRETMKQSRFKGLSGEIRISDNEFLSDKFEIVNIVGGNETRIGLWSSSGFSERRHILWPGGFGKIPRHRVLAENEEKRLLRVLVTASNQVPNLVSVRSDPETGVNIVTGFCVEVFKTCIAPFKYDLEFIPYRGSYDNLAHLIYTQVCKCKQSATQNGVSVCL